MLHFRHTGNTPHAVLMAFQVTLSDESVEWVEGAESFQQEGPMTTFFDGESRRAVIDCWSVKVASFRTDRIVKILRVDRADRPRVAS